MDGNEHTKINSEIVRSVRFRATRHPSNEWAKKIILICDYLEMAKSNKERQAALRERMTLLGQKEMRGIWLTNAEESHIKKIVRAELKILRSKSI